MLLALLGAALAGVPFRLPPGEPAEPWTVPLGLAGFSVGAADAPPCAVLERVGDGWRLVVRDEHGGTQTVRVSLPTTAREREDLAWLAQSLLQPVVPPFGSGPTAPAPPTPARPRRPATPRVAVPEPPSPSPSPTPDPGAAPGTGSLATVPVPGEALATVPAPGGTPATAPSPSEAPATASAPDPSSTAPLVAPTPAPEPIAPADPPARVELAVAGGARLRDGVAPAAVGGVGVGVTRGRWTASIGLSASSPAALGTEGRADAKAFAGRALMRIGARSDGRLAARGSIGAGMSWQRFVQEGAPVADAWVPLLAAEVGVSFRASEAVAIEAGALGTWDTRGLRLWVDGERAAGWSPWCVEPAVSLVFR